MCTGCSGGGPFPQVQSLKHILHHIQKEHSPEILYITKRRRRRGIYRDIASNVLIVIIG